MKSLYLECETGISGDMIVASLLDLGADEEVLRNVLSGIKDSSFEIKISRVMKSGIDCCDFDVVLDAEHENHDHDMDYLYGHNESEDHHHVHGHHRDHEGHHHEHHHHHHDARNLDDIYKIIDGIEMTDAARYLSKKVFQILAEAEAKAHKKEISEVHFHEVGAIDSIVDIVSAAVCFDNLGIEDVIVKRICEGHGHVRCQHGIIPVPVPAVINICTQYALPLSITERKGEYVTPTGAAFVAAVMTSTELPEVMTVEKVGLGAGKREHEIPGVVRAMIIK
ncbi:MAG: LarC family nickel insertion protein [Eubacterium sp.]|nr:LarC family nickel insertion protein [Eubacterium sp.]